METHMEKTGEEITYEDSDANRLKSRVIKKRGRGFGLGLSKELKEGNFESLVTEDNIEVQKSVEGWVLFITGIHAEATEDDIRDKFADFGEVKSIHLNMDRRTGFAKGYALIEFADSKAASEAVRKANRSEILGQTIQVNWAFLRNLRSRKNGVHNTRRSSSPRRD